MAKIERRANVVWKGAVKKGTGELRVESQTFGSLGVGWSAARTQTTSQGKPQETSPEELLAAAHATSYTLALARVLTEEGHAPEHLAVQATAAVEETSSGFRLATMDLRADGWVNGIDQATFRQAAIKANEHCPISKALQPNVDLSLDAELQAQPFQAHG